MSWKEEVQEVLDNHPESKSDYRELYIQFYERRGIKFSKEQLSILRNGPQPETIRRQAAKIKNTKKKYSFKRQYLKDEDTEMLSLF